MALLHIPLDAITEAHLLRLTETGARESLYIDYKREPYASNDAGKKEFLADVSSFANAAGGDIVIGMAEKDGVPSEITPFSGDADKLRLWLEQVARDGIEPRIIGLAVRIIPIAAGGVVFVFRVPKSYNPPHRLKFQGANRFYARSSGGKYEPNVEELRNLFLAAPHLAERIRAFRMERIARIAAGETPVPLSSDPPARAVLHVVPYTAFGGFDPYLIRTLHQKWDFFPPYASEVPTHWAVNFDGVLTLSNGDENATEHASYCQIFRNGALEAVAAVSDGMTDRNYHQEANKLRSGGYFLTRWLRCTGVMPPYVVLFSLLNMRSTRLGHPGLPQASERGQYHFREIQIDIVPEADKATQDMIPLLDHLASLWGGISSGIELEPRSP